MKSFFIVILYFGLFNNLSKAQTHSFTSGLTIGIDQFLSNPQAVSGPNVNRNTYIKYSSGLIYGLEGSYLVKKILINARLLTTNRVYEATSEYPGNPPLPIRISVSGRYYSMPLTISYQLKDVNGVTIFLGVGLVPELIGGKFNRTSHDMLGSGRVLQLEPEDPKRVFAVGGSVQLIAKYIISKTMCVQVQPAFHYFSPTQTPFAETNNSSFSATISLGYTFKTSEKYTTR